MSKVCIEDTKFYNIGSSQTLGWTPRWFGVRDDNDFGDALEEKVKKFQRLHGLKPDGLVGPMTYTRIVTFMESQQSLPDHRSIKCGTSTVPVQYPRVDAQRYYNKLPRKNYEHKNLDEIRDINKIVFHWDAALSTESCFNILKKRGYSTHFSIDNDGTIYQLLNTNHIAYHVKESNKDSIGVDISNAFYLKYNRVYERRGFGLRPIIESKVNGRNLGQHLGYYPEQIKAAKALVKSLTDQYNIPLQIPDSFVNDPKNTAGLMFHYHLNDNKIDTAGFPLGLIIEELKSEA